MERKRILRVAAASLYGLLLAVGRPIADAPLSSPYLVPSAHTVPLLLLMASVFIVSAALGLGVALGPGSWGQRLMAALTIWLTVLVLYYIGCGRANAAEGDLAVPTSAYTLVFSVLTMIVARRSTGWRLVDRLAPHGVATAPRQFSLVQLMLLVLAFAGGSALAAVALRETPAWLSWREIAIIGLKPSSLLVNALFCALALPWILAAFAGRRAVLWALATTVVAVGSILAVVKYWMTPPFPWRANEFITLAVVACWMATLPSYIFAVGLRWFGLAIQREGDSHRSSCILSDA